MFRVVDTRVMCSEAYKALAGLVLFERPLEEILGEITGIAQTWLPGAEATSITLVRGAALHYVR